MLTNNFQLIDNTEVRWCMIVTYTCLMDILRCREREGCEALHQQNNLPGVEAKGSIILMVGVSEL